MAVVVNRDHATNNACFVRNQRSERLNAAARQCAREPQRHNKLVDGEVKGLSRSVRLSMMLRFVAV